MKTNKNWAPCPRCESKKTVYHGKGLYFFTGLIMTSFSIWLLIIPPIGIAGILIGVIIMLASPLIQPKMVCKECRFSWSPSTKGKDKIVKPSNASKSHSKTFWALIIIFTLLLIIVIFNGF